MSSRRRRRTRPTRDQAEAELAQIAEEQQDDDLEPTPEEQARIAAEDAAVENFDQAVRDGAEELPEDGEVELPRSDVESDVANFPPQDPEPATREETDLEEAAREVYRGVEAEWPEGETFEKAKRDSTVEVSDYEVGYAHGAIDTIAVPPIPDFEEIFERGPLAAGIRMLEALLAEARIGYIDAQVDELARVTEEEFTDDERRILAEIAEAERNESGLPGIANAYRTLVRLRAQITDG